MYNNRVRARKLYKSRGIKMKKILSFLSIMMLVLFLAACGSAEKEATPETEGTEQTEQTESTEGTEAPAEQKTILVGTDAAFAPFEYMDKGEIVGFDVDLLAAVMEEAGLEYKLDNIGWDPLFAALQGKQIDMASSGITINEKRLESYDFSSPYFEATHMMVFEEGTDIKSADDLVGKKVGVQNGTTGQSAAEKIIGENNKDMLIYENTAMAFMALQNGDVEVVVTDNVVALEYQKNNPN